MQFILFARTLFVNVPKTHQALSRCTATDRRWRRNMVDLGSCVTDAMRRLISVTIQSMLSPYSGELNGE